MDLPDPGIELGSSALQADSLPTELSGKPTEISGKHTLNEMVSSFCIYFNTTSVIYIIETNTIEACEVLVFNGIQFKQPNY